MAHIRTHDENQRHNPHTVGFPSEEGHIMFSDFWHGLAVGSADIAPDPTGSAAIDGFLYLPAYILSTLAGGAALFGS